MINAKEARALFPTPKYSDRLQDIWKSIRMVAHRQKFLNVDPLSIDDQEILKSQGFTVTYIDSVKMDQITW